MSNNASKLLSNNIKKLLKEKNMTQNELARMMGVSSATVSDWLNCKKYPRVNRI